MRQCGACAARHSDPLRPRVLPRSRPRRLPISLPRWAAPRTNLHGRQEAPCGACAAIGSGLRAAAQGSRFTQARAGLCSRWWAVQDSNLRLRPCDDRTLPTELTARWQGRADSHSGKPETASIASRVPHQGSSGRTRITIGDAPRQPGLDASSRPDLPAAAARRTGTAIADRGPSAGSLDAPIAPTV